MRERERERVRARERRSDERDLAVARSRHWSRSRRREIAPLIAISPSRDRTSERSERKICRGRSRDPRGRSVDRDLAFARSRRREIREEEFELCLSFFWVVACVFLDLCFPSSFPNTRKYFPENFLKCNQTHGNIFLFRKLAFPENMYFLENVLQQPNTA